MAPSSSSTSESVTSSGVVTGDNPIHHALLLLIVQIAVIISLSRLVAFLLRPLRQPRVVAGENGSQNFLLTGGYGKIPNSLAILSYYFAIEDSPEILGGILLGPTALGYIPGFTATIFPQSSVAVLETLADLGLIFFLFLVGLELDIHKISKMGSMALWLAAAGIILPFGFSAIVSSVIHKFLLVEHHVNFGAFTLFMGVALSITAFPVLARILTERKLLNTEVGQLAMSAAALNDVVAWVLLALSVAITDTGSSPLVAAWVLLLGLAFLVFMFLLVQPVAYALAHYHQPIPEPVIAITLVLVLGAAFLTDAIGIHVIFGAFVCGLIIPKDGPFAGILIEKIEDYVSILFLPLYFASSGLKTHLSAISNWTAVLILAMVLATACLGKVMGTVIVAKVWGMERRKSVALGFLMNTKGLVELIVLNIGLSKGVINQELFAIMVIMAIATTFMTTPIVMWLYSPARDMPSYLRRSIIDSGGVEDQLRLLICTTAPWNVQAMINFVEITRGKERKSLRPFALHLMEYTERLSSIRMASFSRRESKKYRQEGNSELDTVQVAFQTYSEQNKVRVKTAIAISAFHDMHEDICNAACTNRVNLILLPFPLRHVQSGLKNVFAKVVLEAPCSVGLLVDNGFAESSTCINPSDKAMLHICVLFFGGPDDREALLLARRMAQHNNVKVTVIQFVIQCLGQQSYMYSNVPRLSSTTLLSHLQKKSVVMRGWEFFKRLARRVMAFFKAPWSARKQVAVITDSSHETHHHNSAQGQSEEMDKNTGQVYVSMDEVEFQHEKELDRQALTPILAATKSLNQEISDQGHKNGNEIHEDSNIININEVMELDSASASNLTLTVCETTDPRKAVLDIANSHHYKLLLVGLHMHEHSPVVQSGAFVNSKVEQGLGALGDVLVSKDIEGTPRPSVLVIKRHSHLMISQEQSTTQPQSNKDSHQLATTDAGEEIELNSSSSNSAPQRWSGESDVNAPLKREGYAYGEDKDSRNISRDGMTSALHDLGGELSSP